MSDLHEELEQIVGSEGVLRRIDISTRASGIWRSDPIQAQTLVRPRTTGEVSQVLKLCNERRRSVVAHGGLTGLVHGADTLPQDVVLSFERMNRIESVDTLNRTMTVQAGVVLQVVQDRAEQAGLLFPLDLGARGSCSIGGNISTNAGGNRVIRYGMTRESVLGLEAVLADGTIVPSMNKMIKNNTGYDLKQLFIGTEGSLGLITRAVLRLRELPRSQETVVVAVDEFEKLPKLLKRLDALLGGMLSAFEVMWNEFYRAVTTPPAKQRPPIPQNYPYYVLIEALGGDEIPDRERVHAALEDVYEKHLVAEAVIAQNAIQRREFWAMRDDVEQVSCADPTFIFDVSLPISDMREYVEKVNAGLEKYFGSYRNYVFGHMGDGNLHFAITVGDGQGGVHDAVQQCVYEPLRDIEGSISAEHGIGLEKKKYLSVSRNPSEIALMKSLKQVLDPNGILNPGKIFDLSTTQK